MNVMKFYWFIMVFTLTVYFVESIFEPILNISQSYLNVFIFFMLAISFILLIWKRKNSNKGEFNNLPLLLHMAAIIIFTLKTFY